ncbi:PhnD/SsuA/transferrin family substrate-binding protein [Pirellulaceae bacterium SH501]
MILRIILSLLLVGIAPLTGAEPARVEQATFNLIVMDPLSKPLSCDCVQGYAQRKYEVFGDYLKEQLKQPVQVVWNGSLVEATKETEGKIGLVVGKYSVVMSDAEKLGVKLTPIASLTGLKGDTTQRGVLVVRSKDSAKELSDLSGYKILYGTSDADEKSGAVDRLFKKNGIPIAEEKQKQRFGACSEAAVALLKMPPDVKAAAVISSYAEPLLEGCGSVKKGDLRVVAQTDDVPFVTVFCPADTDAQLKSNLQQALVDVATDAKVMIALETLDGFVDWDPSLLDSSKESKSTTQAAKKK